VTYFLHGEPGLLEKFREGDRQTLEGVYRAYADPVARVIGSALRRYCFDDSQRGWRRTTGELPDLVQEVFIRAFEPGTRRRFDGDRKYAPYLSQITRNVVVATCAANRGGCPVETDPLIREISLHPNSRQGNDDFADWRTMGLVDRYVAELPTICAAFTKRFTFAAVAARCGHGSRVGRQVVRTLESRLRDGLRTALEETGYFNARNVAASKPAMMSAGAKARETP